MNVILGSRTNSEYQIMILYSQTALDTDHVYETMEEDTKLLKQKS